MGGQSSRGTDAERASDGVMPKRRLNALACLFLLSADRLYYTVVYF